MSSIYQKYGVKGSKSRTSAGTPKSAEGATERKVRESASHQKYATKGSKKCSSAGTPKSAEGAAERKVKESASHHEYVPLSPTYNA